MKLWFLSLLFAVSTLTAPAKPRIAVVDMEQIYKEYQRKTDVEAKVEAQLEALKTSSRVKAVQEMDLRLKALADVVRDKKKQEDVREKAANEFNSLSIDYKSLLQEMNEYIQAEKRKSTVFLVETIEEIIAEVRAEVDLVGKEQDFDLVLERAGKTSSQISPLIYLRDSTDITEIVVKRLNDKVAETIEEAAE